MILLEAVDRGAGSERECFDYDCHERCVMSHGGRGHVALGVSLALGVGGGAAAAGCGLVGISSVPE